MDGTVTDCGVFSEGVVFLNHFNDLPDPRQRGKVMYPLDEILLLALRPGVQVKLLSEDNGLYVFAESAARVAKGRAMRLRQLKWLWARLKQLAEMDLSREELLMRLGAARARAPRRMASGRREDRRRGREPHVPAAPREVAPRPLARGTISAAHQPSQRRAGELWDYYIRLVEVEQAFKTLEGDLAIRPVFHQNEARIEAHIFIAFLAFSLHATLRQRLRAFAPGLTPRGVLDDFAAAQMIDVHVPTTDGRELTLA